MIKVKTKQIFLLILAHPLSESQRLTPVRVMSDEEISRLTQTGVRRDISWRGSAVCTPQVLFSGADSSRFYFAQPQESRVEIYIYIPSLSLGEIYLNSPHGRGCRREIQCCRSQLIDDLYFIIFIFLYLWRLTELNRPTVEDKRSCIIF